MHTAEGFATSVHTQAPGWEPYSKTFLHCFQHSYIDHLWSPYFGCIFCHISAHPGWWLGTSACLCWLFFALLPLSSTATLISSRHHILDAPGFATSVHSPWVGTLAWLLWWFRIQNSGIFCTVARFQLLCYYSHIHPWIRRKTIWTKTLRLVLWTLVRLLCTGKLRSNFIHVVSLIHRTMLEMDKSATNPLSGSVTNVMDRSWTKQTTLDIWWNQIIHLSDYERHFNPVTDPPWDTISWVRCSYWTGRRFDFEPLPRGM